MTESTIDTKSAPSNGVTIGFPLYNEEKYIAATIRSAARQCQVGVVSDNASTDGSTAICEAMTREYPNISLIRHPKNLGASFNFKFVLDQAKTPYFMWLSGHDMIPEGYVERLVRLLEANPDAILAYGASQHIDVNTEPTYKYEYSFWRLLADRSASVRAMGLIRFYDDGSLIHGVWRTDAVRAALEAHGPLTYLGSDGVLLTLASLKGRFVYDPETNLILRDVHPTHSRKAQLKRLKGDSFNEDSESMSPMQRGQYELAASVSPNGAMGLIYRLRARYHLVGRFGSFGETPTKAGLDRLLQRRLVRASVNRLERILGSS